MNNSPYVMRVTRGPFSGMPAYRTCWASSSGTSCGSSTRNVSKARARPSAGVTLRGVGAVPLAPARGGRGGLGAQAPLDALLAETTSSTRPSRTRCLNSNRASLAPPTRGDARPACRASRASRWSCRPGGVGRWAGGRPRGRRRALGGAAWAAAGRRHAPPWRSPIIGSLRFTGLAPCKASCPHAASISSPRVRRMNTAWSVPLRRMS